MGRYVVSKFRRGVSMKATVENSKKCNIAAECKRLKTVSKRRGVNKNKRIKAFDSTLFSNSVRVKPPIREMLIPYKSG